MKAPKRVQKRLWGRRRNGGWVILTDELVNALKEGEVVEFDKMAVGTKQLRKLIDLMTFPDLELLVTTNGNLQLENIERRIVRKDGQYTTTFRLPKLRHSIRVNSGAWKPKEVRSVVVIKPRRY